MAKLNADLLGDLTIKAAKPKRYQITVPNEMRNLGEMADGTEFNFF
ncbi:MAG: hypothetical protein Q8L73_00485 [Methylotenera sp.]|nr:hypothetical protein [Methylotenera sp.]